MNRDDLEVLEAKIMEEVVNRRRLGGYSVESAGILMLAESMLKVVHHLVDQEPRVKSKK